MAAGEGESWISDFPFWYLFELCLHELSFNTYWIVSRKGFCEGSNTLFEGLIAKMTPTCAAIVKIYVTLGFSLFPSLCIYMLIMEIRLLGTTVDFLQ